MAIAEIVSDNKTISVLFPASVLQTRGNLMYLDTATPKKASLRSDTGSAAGNMADFAPLFLGVCNEDRLAADATTLRGTIITDGIFDCDCASRAWQYGELVGIYRDATPLNANQQVALAAHPGQSIGICVQDTGGVAKTKVRCRLVSRLASQLAAMFGGYGSNQFAGTAGTLADSANTLTVASAVVQVGVPTAARSVILPAPALSKGLMFLIVNNSAGANALNIRDSGDTTTIQAVAQNKRCLVVCDGTTWFALYGA